MKKFSRGKRDLKQQSDMESSNSEHEIFSGSDIRESMTTTGIMPKSPSKVKFLRSKCKNWEIDEEKKFIEAHS